MSTDQSPPSHRPTPRSSLFVKYFVTMLIAVVAPLLLGVASEAWFGYRGQRAALNELLQAESRAATERIQTFIDGIRDQLGWAVQLPWMVGDEERHRVDALRLLRQVPAISSITLVDEMDRERAFISRQDVNRIGLGASMASDPAVKGAHASKVWFGPVRYERDSEPYMTIAVAGNPRCGRNRHCRHQPETDSESNCCNQDRRDRPCLRNRRFGSAGRSPGYQPGASRPRCLRGLRIVKGRGRCRQRSRSGYARCRRQAGDCHFGPNSKCRLDSDRAATGRRSVCTNSRRSMALTGAAGCRHALRDISRLVVGPPNVWPNPSA
jgi:hypothetical protein